MTRSPLLVAACAIGAAALLAPPPALAQRGHPPAHGGGAHVVVGGGVYVGAPYYYPYAYPWYPYGYGFWYPSPYYYGPYYYDDSSSLQLQVTPKQTEVFVDGHYAGVVDNFDGTFQRLHVEPGEHELQLFLAGHRSVTQHVYVQPHGTFRVKYTMETLAPGEPEPVRPQGTTTQPARAQGTRPGGAPAPERPTSPSPEGAAGSIAIRVQPGDAEILIDGERWTGGGDDRLVVQLSPGTHQIDVRKDGYRSFTTEITVRPGESSPLNVSLGRAR